MAQDFIPSADGDSLAWKQNVITYATNNLAGLGLAGPDLNDVTDAQGPWESTYLDNENKQAAARAARQLKDDNRKTFEAAICKLVRRLQASPQVSDDEWRALGITVRDTTATAPSAAVAAATRPAGVTSTAQRLRHEIRFFDESTPTRRPAVARLVCSATGLQFPAIAACGILDYSPARRSSDPPVEEFAPNETE